MGGRVLTRWLQFISFALLALTISPAVDAQRQERNNSPGANPQQAQATPKKTRPATPEAAAEEAREDAATIRARERWFYEQREYPRGFIPADARLKALQRVEEMRRAERARGLVPPPTPQTHVPVSSTVWTSLGPQPTGQPQPIGLVSGRTAAVAIDPTNANIAYVGGAQGGIWKTTDGGFNWAPLTDGQPSLATGAIAIDPSAASCGASGPCQIIYVGTGEQTFSSSSYYGAGILKSTNGGTTWQQIPGPFVGPFSSGTGGARISSLAIRPGASTEILAGLQIFVNVNNGASSGVYRSTDSGQTWTQVLPGAAATEVVFDPRLDPVTNRANVAYAALGTPVRLASTSQPDADNGVYKSTDGGATWTKLTGAFPTTNLGRIELAIALSAPDTLYASVANASVDSDDLQGVFKTTNGGSTWVQLAPGNTMLSGANSVCSGQCWYDHVIKVHPSDPNVVYLGGAARSYGTMIFSTDGGTTWTGVARGSSGAQLHVDQHAIAIVPTGGTSARIYVGNDGGVWSADLPTSASPPDWVNRNFTLSLTQFYPGQSSHPADLDVIYGGTQDNGTQKASFGTIPFWDRLSPCGDGGFTALDPTMPSVVYATCQNIAINKSLNDGATFATAQTGINTNNERGAFIPPLVLDEANPQRLYFGTCRVWRTTDGAATWTALSSDLTGDNSPSGCPGTGANAGFEEIRAIAIAPSDPKIVYVGTSDGRILRTLDATVAGLAAWQNLTTAQLPPRLVTAIAVSISDPNTAYATFSGFSGTGANFLDTKGHVFKTTNGGASWTDISGVGAGTLPNIPANDIVVDPDVPGTLYVGTDVGVFVSTDDGVNWSTMMTGLPNVAVLGLKLRQPPRILRAATHGRGMWQIWLANFNPVFNISSLAPSSTNAGSAGFTLTVQGTGFTPSSVVRWNGVDLPMVSATATQLQATVAASDVVVGAFVPVTVFDPDPAKGTSNQLMFSVTNPTPTITSISPSQHAADGQGFTLTVNGTNFIGTIGSAPTSQIRWNGNPRTTNASLVSNSQITVQIPGTDVQSTSRAGVTVFNPPPAGGSSNALAFPIGTPPANDNFASSIAVNTSPFTDTRNNAAAGNEAGDPVAPCTVVNGSNGNFGSIWYVFTPTANTTATLDTVGSGYDSVLSIWTGPALGALTNVACDDDSGGNLTSRLTNVALTAATTYHIMVSGFDVLDGGNTVFNFSVAPGLSAAPTTISVSRGASGTSTITATPPGIPLTAAVTFSCSGLPSQSACSFNPISVTPGANPATTMLTITTTAPSMIVREPSRWPASPPVVVLLLSLIAALVLVVGLTGKRSAQWLASRSGRVACCLCAAMILAGLGVACGGGGGGPPPPPPNPGTPPGTYTVTVTGSSGATSATTQITLQVN